MFEKRLIPQSAKTLWSLNALHGPYDRGYDHEALLEVIFWDGRCINVAGNRRSVAAFIGDRLILDDLGNGGG